MYYKTSTGYLSPTAHIAVNRNRLKLYGENVYLKGNTHFEIELFNPKTTKILAKIYLDGICIAPAGFIIKPGQRVFLERWLDESKKFLFETYEIDESPEAKNAVLENGKVRVEFFDQEITGPSTSIPTTWTYQPYAAPPNTPADIPIIGPMYGGTTLNQVYVSSRSSGIMGQNSSIAQSIWNKTETGRIEKGEESTQSLIIESSNYHPWPCTTICLKILSESQKPVELHEIRNYCTNCGSRNKKSSWNFCPTCGTKI